MPKLSRWAHGWVIIDSLLGPAASQLREVADAGAAERFLDLVRQLLASGAARLGEPAAVFGKIRKNFPDAAGLLATPKSTLDDLYRVGAIVERDKNHRTKKARVGGASLNTWAIEGGEIGIGANFLAHP